MAPNVTQNSSLHINYTRQVKDNTYWRQRARDPLLVHVWMSCWHSWWWRPPCLSSPPPPSPHPRLTYHSLRCPDYGYCCLYCPGTRRAPPPVSGWRWSSHDVSDTSISIQRLACNKQTTTLQYTKDTKVRLSKGKINENNWCMFSVSCKLVFCMASTLRK